MAKNSPAKKFISIIIPAFKQERTIEKDLLQIENSLKQLRYPFEIITVVDGRIDNTFQNAKKIRSSNIKVVGYKSNHGKGYAIRYGMVRSKGNIIGFLDAGMDINPNGLALLLEQFEWEDADIIIGSKRHPSSRVNYPLLRRSISFLSQIWIKVLFGLYVRDTQVGLKFFRRKVLEDVLPRLLVKRFAFDIEMLVVAYHLGYKNISEVPVELDFDVKGSGLSQNLFKEITKAFYDTLAIFYRLKILHYYDNSSRRKWKYDPELNFKVNV
jgi:glycosyltransferase involved in cell wall biosynthesis